MTLRAIGCALLLFAVDAAAEDAPTSPAARARFERGLEHYRAKDYPAAVAEFEAAYALEPHRDFLFAWAQAERLQGNCGSALSLYQRFLDTAPGERHAALARQSMARCEVESPPTPPPSVPPRVESPPPETASAWYRDALGGGLCAGAAVSAGAGLWLLGQAHASARSAAALPTEGDYARRLEGAKTQSSWATALLGTGGALLVAGVVRYAWVGREGPQVAVGLGPSGGTVFVGGRF